MEGVVAWVRQVLMVALVAAFAEFLLPEGGMRKYAQVVLGLVILLTLIGPAWAWAGLPGDLETILERAVVQGALADPAASAEPRAPSAAALGPAHLQAFRTRVAEGVAATTRSVDGIEAVGVEVSLVEDPARPDYGAIEGLTLRVHATGSTPVRVGPLGPRGEEERASPQRLAPETAAEIRRRVSATFGIPGDRIKVVTAEGRDDGDD